MGFKTSVVVLGTRVVLTVVGSLVVDGLEDVVADVVVVAVVVVGLCVVVLGLRTRFLGLLVVATSLKGLKVGTSKSNAFRSKDLEKDDL